MVPEASAGVESHWSVSVSASRDESSPAALAEEGGHVVVADRRTWCECHRSVLEPRDRVILRVRGVRNRPSRRAAQERQ